MKEKIVIVADDPENSRKLGEMLEKEEYECTLSDANEPVFTLPEGEIPDLIIFDVTIMELGFEVVKLLREEDSLKDVPVVYIIDYDEENKSELNEFLSDKFEFAFRSEDFSEISEMVRNRFAGDKAVNAAEEGFSGLIESDETTIPEGYSLDELSYKLVRSLALLSEARDSWIKGHARRTAIYAKELMRRMGGSEQEQFEVYCAALVHDIGMISVPADILNKKMDLSSDDYIVIKSHTTAGSRVLESITEMPFLAESAKYHHERYDGKGYPDALKGTDIPRYARIISVADAYDAMTSPRPHRKALSQQKVREEFQRGNGTQFDPEVVRIILQAIYEDKDYDSKQAVRSDWKILLVDDDPMVLKMASYILGRHKQYTCCKANSGKQALKTLKDEPDIDLILLDVEMPIMDGVETLIKIRSDKATKDIPVIFVTADSSRQTLEKAMKYKVNGYITKPFAPHFFLKRINEILNQIE